MYRLYYFAFERHGEESLQGLAFFFGLLFIIEVGLLLIFGVDYRFVEARYIGPGINIGFVSIPWRMLIGLIVGLAMVAGVALFNAKTFTGRAILAVSQGPARSGSSAAIPSTSRKSRSAFPSPRRSSPVRCSSSFSRLSHRSGVISSGAYLQSACSAA